MRGMLVQLSPHEEAALRKIGADSADPIRPDHIRRLLQLGLIEGDGRRWSLTEVGCHRHDSLVADDAGHARMA